MRSAYVLSLVCLCLFAQTHADESDSQLASYQASGEFVLAQRAADGASDHRRDQILAQLASSQSYSGEPVAAARTIRGIQSQDQRESAIEGARGGGSFADFGSLMQLIETTVVPDTWEALGGPSTMAPYPQGVYVDPDGTVKTCETLARSHAFDDLKAAMRRGAAGKSGAVDGQSWRHPARLRVVSLRRLKNQISQNRLFGRAVSESVLHLAGLSQVRYIMLQDDDILLAGPVGGIEKIDGWFRDQDTGLNTLRSDFLFTCLASSQNNRPFGCTIDPTPEGLQRAAVVAQGVQNDSIPVGQAAEKMQEALGMQRVEVFGAPGDTPIGYVMVEADRHMKQLALGEREMPNGVKNYLDVIDESIAQGPPNQLLLRLWFTASPRSVRADAGKTVFEIAGTPIKLSGENQRALANGQRGRVTADFRTEAFVDEFNQHWGDIRSEYPIYSALESIYRVASVSALVHKHARNENHIAIVSALAADSSTTDWVMPTPRQVASIATHHTVRHGRTRHHVVLASGGVSVDARQSVMAKLVSYPSLASHAIPATKRPQLVQKWWWDAK